MLGLVLLPACGIASPARILPGWLEACPAPSPAGSVALDREVERRAELQDRIARLERRLAGLPTCPPPRVTVELPPEPTPPEPAPPVPLPEEPPPEEPPPEEPESEFDRRVEGEGGEVSEELTVTLIWDDESDLDLQVHCPDGGVAGVLSSGIVSECGGGILDVDANGFGTGGLQMMDRPVENIRFGSSAAPGYYQIQVRISANYLHGTEYHRTRNLGPHPFRVRVLSRGEEQVFEGVHPGADGANVWFDFTH